MQDKRLVTGRASVACLKTRPNAQRLKAAVSPAPGSRQMGSLFSLTASALNISLGVKASACLCFHFSAPPALTAEKWDKYVTKSSARNVSPCLL